jgi:branched-chain amino acid transport system ATP-binding protein
VTSPGSELLRIVGLSAGYTKVDVLKDINLTVRPGEVVALLGSNGAGKTTLVRTVVGTLRQRTGDLSFDGQVISRTSAPARARAGLAVVPEGRRVYRSLSVRENLILGGWVHRRQRAELEDRAEGCYRRFPVLAARRKQLAASLSGGEAQMLAIAMALMAEPKLLILDEPSLGLAPLVVDAVMSHVGELRDAGTSILLIEQNARKALNVADRAYVLELGAVVLEGQASELATNPLVRRAYIGA